MGKKMDPRGPDQEEKGGNGTEKKWSWDPMTALA
jgi:hypothetical protein